MRKPSGDSYLRDAYKIKVSVYFVPSEDFQLPRLVANKAGSLEIKQKAEALRFVTLSKVFKSL